MKRTVSFISDSVFWYLLYSLPVLILLLVSFRSGEVMSVSQMLSAGGFSIDPNNIILVTLTDLFGTNGPFALFSGDGFFLMATWFVSVFLVHLVVDIILFVPRYAHHFLAKANKGDSE